MRFYFLERRKDHNFGGVAYRFHFNNRADFLEWLRDSSNNYRALTYTEIPLSCVKKVLPKLINGPHSSMPWPK